MITLEDDAKRLMAEYEANTKPEDRDVIGLVIYVMAQAEQNGRQLEREGK